MNTPQLLLTAIEFRGSHTHVERASQKRECISSHGDYEIQSL